MRAHHEASACQRGSRMRLTSFRMHVFTQKSAEGDAAVWSGEREYLGKGVVPRRAL